MSALHFAVDVVDVVLSLPSDYRIALLATSRSFNMATKKYISETAAHAYRRVC